MGDNDRRSKCLSSIAILCIKFKWQSKHAWSDYEWQKVQTCVIKLRSVHSFILRRSSNTRRLYRVHTCDACIITTWRLGLWVTRGAHNNKLNMLLRSTAPNTKWLQTPVWDPPCHGNVNHKNLLHLWYSNKCLFFFFSRKEWVNKSLNVVQIMLTLLNLLC